jgi:hypothetical protein
MLYKVYAENVIDAISGIKNRRFIANCEGTNTGAGIFDLYADECGDEEEIVIVPADAEAMGRKGGSVKSPAKSVAAQNRNAKRKAEGKREGGRPKKPAAS